MALSKEMYDRSVRRALFLKYVPIPHINAYDDYDNVVYIKNNKKWIHHLPSLMAKLNLSTERELEALGYNVDDYWHYNSDTCYTCYDYDMEPTFGSTHKINQMASFYGHDYTDPDFARLSDEEKLDLYDNQLKDW